MIQIKDLRHCFLQYDENGDKCGETLALKDINLEIQPGSFTVLLGSNGSGKSTLAKHLNALLLPTAGKVFIEGMDTADEKNVFLIRQKAGMVFQNPDNQIVASVIEEDVAFGPENLAVSATELQRRVTECLKKVGMEAYRLHAPGKLSGGQKQRIAIAGVMAMKPDCIILDEATAMLDPKGRREVLWAVHELNKKENISIILITHHMEEAVEADRILVMDGAGLVMDGTPQEIFSCREELIRHGLVLPDVTELGYLLKKKGLKVKSPILREEELIEEVLALAKEPFFAKKDMSEGFSVVQSQEKTPILELRDVGYIYSEKTPYEKRALEGINLKIFPGSRIGLVGHTGSGKSTLLQLLNGLLKPTSGSVFLEGRDARCEKDLTKRVGLVFQYPEYQLFEESVIKDVCFGPKNLRVSASEAESRAKLALELVGIAPELFNASPFSLSGGQKRRVAIAGVLAMKPDVLILDEPTAGLDPAGRREILELLRRINEEQNVAILLVSHSMEDVADFAKRVLVLSAGQLIFDGRPEEVFSNKDELETMGLALPCALRITKKLKQEGINCRSALRISEAAKAIAQVCKKEKGGESC